MGLSNYEVALLVVFVICCMFIIYQSRYYSQKSLEAQTQFNKKRTFAIYEGIKDGTKEWLSEYKEDIPKQKKPRKHKITYKKRK